MKQNQDLIETATKAGDFQVLVEAVTKAGFKQSLKDSGPYTVFAPTDAAFEQLPKKELDNLLRPKNKESLQFLLRNHIVLGKIMSKDLQRLETARTAKGEKITIGNQNGLWINDAKILSADLEATNGVLHRINKVLLYRPRATANRNRN